MEILTKQVSDFLKLKGKNIIMVRHGECFANYAGVIAGITDSRLTIKGREQSNQLYGAFYKNMHQFKGIYCSDLSRSKDTAHIALGFPQKSQLNIIVEKRLRELNFGQDENIHYDSLPQQRKDLINHIDYEAPQGESWKGVKKRCIQFFSELQMGNFLLFTHGGLMCSLTWDLGIQDCPTNCSVIGLQLNDQTSEPEKLNFNWQFPTKEEI